MVDEILPLQVITAKLGDSIVSLEIEITSSMRRVCNDMLHVTPVKGVRNATVALAQ